MEIGKIEILLILAILIIIWMYFYLYSVFPESEETVPVAGIVTVVVSVFSLMRKIRRKEDAKR